METIRVEECYVCRFDEGTLPGEKDIVSMQDQVGIG